MVWDVYTSEVDDHGVDFVAKPPHGDRYFEIQVKPCRNFSYEYIVKEKLSLADKRLVCYLHFEDGKLPDFCINPATAWEHPNAVLVDHPYDKPGKKSASEWGISISREPLINTYQIIT